MEDEGLDWRRYAAAALRYKWLIFGLTALGAVAGGVVAWNMTPMYYVEGKVWIEEPPRGGRGPIEARQPLESYGWVELLQTHAVLDGVVRDRRLNVGTAAPTDTVIIPHIDMTEAFQPGAYSLTVDRSGARYSLLDGAGAVIDSAALGEPVGAERGFTVQAPRGALEPSGAYGFQLFRTLGAARSLAGALDATVVRDGNFMVISLEGEEPRAAAATLQVVLDEFVKTAADLKRARLDELTRIMEDQLTYARDNLGEAELALESFRAVTITLPSQSGAPIAGGVQAAQDPVIRNYYEQQFELDQVRRDQDAIRRALGGETAAGLGSLEIVPSVQDTRELTLALTDLAAKRAERRALLQQYTDEHPQVQEVTGQIASIEARTIPALAQGVLNRLSATESDLQRRIGTASAQIRRIPARSMEEQRLVRNRDIADRIYRNIQSSYEEARLAAVSSIPDIRQLDPVAVPIRPVNDERIRMFLVILLGGLALGLVGAFLRDQFDPRLQHPDQVRQMGLPILAAIPHIHSPKQLGKFENAAELVEAFRNVRLNVSFENGNGGPVMLTVTSPGSGDGKSFVSANLALAYAELGRRTLLVDGDTRRGALHRMFGIERKPGLLDFLDGTATLSEVIKPTPYPALDLLPAGTRLSRGPELLSTTRLTDLLDELRGRYDTILVDSPPLGAGVDPLVLATATRNALIVLRTGSTDREMTESKLDNLERFPVHVMGAVVNDVAAGRLYGGYEIYGYLPGYEPHDEAPAGVG
ncbi:MAG: polysaccharide biosynthesis tyrosine autokinase [Gemmatimonadota bacterium]